MQAPDHLERARALDISQSFIVQAPAGSGKTELLTMRFLHALLAVERPSEVVAITFTRKAAAEMRSRIRRFLVDQDPASIGARACAHHLARGFDLIAQPEQLRVLNFDIFFRQIASLAPISSGIARDAQVEEDATALYRDAALETLQNAALSQQVATLLSRLEFQLDQAVGLIADLLAKRDQWLAMTYAPETQDAALAAQIVGQAIAQVLAVLRGAILSDLPAAQISEWIFLANFAQSTLATGIVCSAPWPLASPDTLDEWHALFKIVTTQKGELRKSIDKNAGFLATSKAEKARIQALWVAFAAPAMIAAQSQALSVIPRLRDAAAADHVLGEILTLLRYSAGNLSAAMARRNVTDFTAIAIASRSLMHSDDAKTRMTIAAGIAHLLVDEFQDTSITQFEFLEGLAATWAQSERSDQTLFCVGDPMQSIYRFRQAEVSLFTRAQEQGIGGRRLQSLTLAANFRSEPVITNWVNATFAPAMATPAFGTSRPVHFAPSIAMVPASAASSVQMQAFAVRADEVNFVADAVEAAWAQGERSIALLVRQRRHAAPFVAALQARAIPTVSADALPLAERAWARDFLNVVLALSEREDTLAWAALLRAPWCGVMLPDLTLTAEAAHTQACDWWRGIESVLQANSLSSDGQARLGALHAALAPCLAAMGWRNVADLAEAAWARIDAAACYADFDAESFAALVEVVRAHAGAGRVQDRLALLRAVQKITQHGARDGVQVLTLHKAKGLQFNIVAMPQLARLGRNDAPPLVRWQRFERGAVVAPAPRGSDDPAAPIFAWLKALDAHENAQERTRLAYVGATRAKQRLLLTATLKVDDHGDAVVAPQASLWAVIAAHSPAQWQAGTSNAVADVALGAAPVAPPLLRRASMPASLAAPEALQAAPQSCASYQNPAAQIAARAFGTLVHTWLGQWGRSGKWGEAAQAWLEDALASGKTPAALRPQAIRQFQTMVTRVANCPHAKFIFDPDHRWVRDEQSFVVTTDLALQTLQTLRPDRLICDTGGEVWVIDYKTSTPNGQDERALGEFLTEEKAQYRETMLRYAAAVRSSGLAAPGATIRCALYFPLMSEFAEI